LIDLELAEVELACIQSTLDEGFEFQDLQPEVFVGETPRETSLPPQGDRRLSPADN